MRFFCTMWIHMGEWVHMCVLLSVLLVHVFPFLYVCI